jgi:hypothetical protein
MKKTPKSPERKAFEKWMKKFHSGHTLERQQWSAKYPDPEYISAGTQHKWLGFLAGNDWRFQRCMEISSAMRQVVLADNAKNPPKIIDDGAVITIEEAYDGFDICISPSKEADVEQRFTFSQEEPHKDLKKVFKHLGFKNVKYREVY